MRLRKHPASIYLGLLGLMAVTSAAASPDVRLVEAVAERNTALVRTLLAERGVDVNSRRADGATALLWAAHWDDREAIDLLLRAGANVNAADDYGVTPLARACENASDATVTRLLDAGANPNATQANGLTPLMVAARTGNLNVVKVLLARGASVNAATASTDETALSWAVAERHVDIVRALIASGASVHPRPLQAFSPIIGAAANGDIETAKVLIAAGARVNDTASDGTHPLAYAVVTGQSAFAHFLLEQGADPNGALDGITALHAAAGPVDTWLRAWSRRHGGGGRGRLKLSERPALVKHLLARGADPNRRMTASEMAAQGFLRNGAFDTFEIGTGDLSGATPLWVAAWAMNPGAGRAEDPNRGVAHSNGEVLRSLLAAGARPDITTNDGSTTLMAAAGCGRWAHVPKLQRAEPQPAAEEAVRILVEARVDVNAANEADFTALHCAAFAGMNELVRYLVEHGSDIDARDWRGRTPFRLAEGAKQSFHFQPWPEVAALLKELGADTTLGIPGTTHERLRGLLATK